MDTNINYTIVGAFVVLLISAIVLGIIWLSSGLSLQQDAAYLIYMQESVSGMNKDAPVEYNGVNVGTVKNISLNQKNPHIIELLINIKRDTPITRGTVATLTTRGLTGVVYIALKDDGKDLRKLEIDSPNLYPIIKTAPSIFTRLDTALSELSTNLRKVTESIQSVLDDENQQSIKATLHNLQEMTASLALNSQKLDGILKNTEKTVLQFGPIIQSSSNALTNINDFTRNLSQVSMELKQNPAILIRGVNRQGVGPGE